MRTAARRALIAALAAAPVLVAAAALLGFATRHRLAAMHPTVQLAAQIQTEESGGMKQRTDAVEAFRATGESVESLYGAGRGDRKAICLGGALLGGWIGLVFAAKLLRLSVRRRRTDFQPDRGAAYRPGAVSGTVPRSMHGKSSFQSSHWSNNMEMTEHPQNFDAISHRLAVRTAIVAAVFSLVVASLMLYDFLHRSMKDPFSTSDPAQVSAHDALKAVLARQPANEAIKEAIRRVDQESREAYFRPRAFALWGPMLLCGGVVVALAAARWAATLRRRLPQPPAVATQVDWEATWTPTARWTVGGLFVVLALMAAALTLSPRATLAEKAEGKTTAVVGVEKQAVAETETRRRRLLS